MIQKFDIVGCPFDEVGLVRNVEDGKIWGNSITVEIIKTKGIFNQLGEVVEFRTEDLIVVKELHF